MIKRSLRFEIRRCLLAILTVCVLSACSLPNLLWPEVNFESVSDQPLSVGAAAVIITPSGFVFLAGGLLYRPALNVHDDIWARAVVIDDGTHRVAMVALDLIGVFYDHVVRFRGDIEERLKAAGYPDIDYVLIAATHTHSAPDVLGLWSPQAFCLEDPYIQFIGQCVAEAVETACKNMRPARIRVAAGTSGDPPLSRDTRPPICIDDTLTIWQAIDAETEAAIATCVHYASHPILIPSFNFDISCDFVHTLRVALESGMAGDDGPVEAMGGVCLFFNGALGGRITPANAKELTAAEPPAPGYALVEGYGYQLARRAQQLLNENAQLIAEPVNLDVISRQIRVPVTNILMGGAIDACFMERAKNGLEINSEVGIMRIGPMAFLAVPGMIFPELIQGPISPLPGNDFPDAPLETPPLAELSDEPYVITVGLANDMLGNIIPKALWDQVPPFTDGSIVGPYGEIISPGPDTAAIVVNAFAAMCNQE